jgi:hypothetical protein
MLSTKTRKVTLQGVNRAWRERVPFDANGTLTADFNMWPSSGRLNPTERAQLDHDATVARALGVPFYVVWSYATPIAWSFPGYEYRVSQKFSVTTSKHQGKLY